jgi:hypothetical protein
MKETFKDIPNYVGIYQVSNLGKVKSLSRKVWNGRAWYVTNERILKNNLKSTGYFKVILCKDGEKKNRSTHQLVAEAFLNHTPCGFKLVVNHINFNKLDNRVVNLEIVTHRENTNKKHLKTTSKYIGVGWSKVHKKWRAQIVINKERKYLGCFINELDAHYAYQTALKELTPY